MIVLVITIIVMIILATVIILSLDSSNIIERANEAKEAMNIANAKEIVALAKAEWELDKEELSKEYADVTEYAYEKLEEAGYKTEGNDGISLSENGAINSIYVDKNEHIAIIPEGFSISTNADEQTIDYGLVIVDKDGNEFVWVPVDDMNMFKRTTTYTGTITEPDSGCVEPLKTLYECDLREDAGGCLEYKEVSVSNDPTGEVAEYNAMYSSVEENHGFYIARYEAGLPEGKTPTTVTIKDKPISKKGATVWNLIPWGTSMTEVGTEGAVYRARQMYKDSKSVVSTLCYGVQWDSALQFISNRGIKDKKYAIDSTGKGNYTGSILSAGFDDSYSLNNIYDMAGNVSEWTMTQYLSEYGCRVFRGDFFIDNYYGDHFSASWMENTPVEDCHGYDSGSLGFRIALYIK